MKEPLTTMQVTNQQARFFLLLSKAGAWDILNGSITIHIDAQGNPVKAETHQFTSLSTPRVAEVLTVVV
jgi:hypothetical protein